MFGIADNVWNAIVFTSISGLSTGIGGLLVIMYGSPTFKSLGHMLSFSAGVMLFLSFMDLMPEAVLHIGYVTANLWFFGGMLFFAAIAYFVPEPDFEENFLSPKTSKKKLSDPDLRKNKNNNNQTKNQNAKNNKNTNAKSKEEQYKSNERKYLLSLGIVTALGISIHNFPEGIAVYLSCLRGLEIGLPLTFAIALHNIPEGMAVASPIYHSTQSKWKAFYWSLISGACEPVGAIIVGTAFSQYLTDYVVHCMLAGVAGIMVLICIKELMPATLKYVDGHSAAISHVLGMVIVMLGVHYLHGNLGHNHAHGAPAEPIDSHHNPHHEHSHIHHFDHDHHFEHHHHHDHHDHDHHHDHHGHHGHDHHDHHDHHHHDHHHH